MASDKTSVVIGCDHAAVPLKDEIIAMLQANGYSVTDLGTHGTERVDYPDIAVAVAQAVASGKAKAGIIFCGTGIGVSISANKVAGIRAALCHDHFTAKMARNHNDANVLCAGARVTGAEVVKEMVHVFLTTPFEGGRHAERVKKINALDV